MKRSRWHVSGGHTACSLHHKPPPTPAKRLYYLYQIPDINWVKRYLLRQVSNKAPKSTRDSTLQGGEQRKMNDTTQGDTALALYMDINCEVSNDQPGHAVILLQRLEGEVTTRGWGHVSTQTRLNSRVWSIDYNIDIWQYTNLHSNSPNPCCVNFWLSPGVWFTASWSIQTDVYELYQAVIIAVGEIISNYQRYNACGCLPHSVSTAG